MDREGRPTIALMRYLNSAFRALTDAQNATAAALAAAGIANAAAEAVTAESSITNSFPTNFVAPLISADNTGVVTIADHDRQYGDGTSVAVDGDTIATGEANPDIVRVYYDDEARAGGAVTYAFTVDPADPPIQGGDRHVIGAVEIPAAGTADGGYVRPPGYTGVIP